MNTLKAKVLHRTVPRPHVNRKPICIYMKWFYTEQFQSSHVNTTQIVLEKKAIVNCTEKRTIKLQKPEANYLEGIEAAYAIKVN